MVRVATYDPGRIRDRFAMLGGDITPKKIQILNAKEWKKTNFTVAEDEIAEINRKKPFDYHICESNNQGWHVIDNLRTLKNIPVRPVNTSNNLTAKTARLGKSLDKNKMVEWIEWARLEKIIEFPSGKWTAGITELNRQLNRFVMKKTNTGYRYEAAEEDDHDDLVMALVIMCHFARMKILKLDNTEKLPLGLGTDDLKEQEETNVFSRNVAERLKMTGMGEPEINIEDW